MGKFRDPYDTAGEFVPLTMELKVRGFLKPHCQEYSDGRFSIKSSSDGSNQLFDHWSIANNQVPLLLYDALEGECYLTRDQVDHVNLSEWIYQEFGMQLSHLPVHVVSTDELMERVRKKGFYDAFRRRESQAQNSSP